MVVQWPVHRALPGESIIPPELRLYQLPLLTQQQRPGMIHSNALAALALGFSFGSELAEDKAAWSQWRGPDGTGVSLKTDWASEGKEDHLWISDVGLGYSTVVIGDGLLYTMGHDVPDGLDVVYALDAMTGEEAWTMAFESKIWNTAHEGGTVNTPTLDGDHLYVLNHEGNLFCLEASTGEDLWHRFLVDENELTLPRWGMRGSPLAAGKNLILNVGKVMSVDKKTGESNWITT
ncbi:MAG: outer membrane protein assembly factor BamB [Candidatus Paceibacteria bacterium]|jgi:outer membrane protein assembly factor BamB